MMFNFFNKKQEPEEVNVKMVREQILSFIKEELQRLDGGEGSNVSHMQLYLSPASHRFIYETAVYNNEPGKFKNEIQRLADNFALELPANWKLDLLFVDELPHNGISNEELNIVLVFGRGRAASINRPSSGKARISLSWGTAEQQEYELRAAPGRYNIGRESKVQASDGTFRTNTIAFPAELAEENKFISRQHAHIEWDQETETFKLYADEGGVPPANKTKIRSAADESVQKLNSTHIGYPLTHGDEVILGDVVIMQFSIV
jgi:hypothetical protein